MKQPVKCWNCGGHHLSWDCPMREHDEGNSRKVLRLRDKLKAENQQDKSMEAKRLGLERSKEMIERGTALQDFKNFDVQLYMYCIYIPMYWNNKDGVIPRGRGMSHPVFDPVCMMYIL